MIHLPKIVPFLAIFVSGTLAGSPAVAQESQEWDVTLARGNTREIDFTTDEGTWLSVDISPDGRWIVFDLLGHVYRLPSDGGDAESLTQESGVAVNYHPRYSPDGQHLAFISDRGGQNNLWIMNADGSEPHAVHCEMEPRPPIGPSFHFELRSHGFDQLPADSQSETGSRKAVAVAGSRSAER